MAEYELTGFTGAEILNALKGIENRISALSGEPAAFDINRALETNSDGRIIASAITATELNALDDIDSNIQDQLDAITGGGVMTVGTGISSGTGTIWKQSSVLIGNIIKTDIIIDLTGLTSGGTADDIIGKLSTANCHIGLLSGSVNGTIFGGRMTCLEAPVGGDPDINLYAATLGTGTQDQLITDLDAGAQLLINGGDQSVGTTSIFTAIPSNNKYMYLTTGDVTNVIYTAGKLLIELWGY